MSEQELLARLENVPNDRRRRMVGAVQNGATRSDGLRVGGERCAFCNKKERGGGLRIYHLRNGEELLVGHPRCTDYLEYLISHR